jgi:outer membrane biosynthesis protein TonB
MHTILNAFEEEDPEAAKEGLNRPCVKDLDIEFTRMIKKIKLPDTGGLEAAAADFGAQRAAMMASAAPKPAPEPEPEVDVVEEQKKLETKADADADDDEDELC